MRVVVTPEALPADWTTDKPITGAAIQVRRSFGAPSRFEIAKIAARYFPLAEGYVEEVIDEGIYPKEDFPSAPFPKDKTIRRSETVVEFITPPNVQGMGTTGASPLQMNADPIQGVAIILPDQDMDLLMVHMRLPAKLRDLAGAILAGVENNLAAGGVD
ncbi:hypothetical protein ACFSM5_13375 [Lacibacterium aquatile]|uniref:Uncharacterized protein n=1 Tax=Lacibacterium aquatile TaxID=1168082 RepID=A0ABW5DSJ0_9PROT